MSTIRFEERDREHFPSLRTCILRQGAGYDSFQAIVYAQGSLLRQVLVLGAWSANLYIAIDIAGLLFVFCLLLESGWLSFDDPCFGIV